MASTLAGETTVTIAPVRALRRRLQKAGSWLRERWYRTAGSIFGVAMFFFSLWLQVGGYQSRIVAYFIAAAGLLIVALLVVLIRTEDVHRTPRAWARLDFAESRWRVLPHRLRDVVCEAEFDETSLPTDDGGASLAVAPGGQTIATVVARTLRILTIDPDTGDIRRWREPIALAYDDARVLAIAPKGSLEMWCAVAAGNRTRWTAFRRTTENPEWVVVEDHDAARYAAFVGASLVFVDDKGGHKVSSGTKATEWAPSGTVPDLDPKRLSALDVGDAGDTRFLSLLASRDGNDRPILVSLPVDHPEEAMVTDLDHTYDHVAIVRAPDAEASSLCVLTADGRRVSEHFPFRESDPRQGAA